MLIYQQPLTKISYLTIDVLIKTRFSSIFAITLTLKFVKIRISLRLQAGCFMSKMQVKIVYIAYVIIVMLAYISINLLIGYLLVKENFRLEIADILSPFLSVESLIITFFACTRVAQKRFKMFSVIRKPVDIINVLALSTAVLATIFSFSKDHIALGVTYAIVTVLGFFYITYEIKRNYKKQQKNP